MAKHHRCVQPNHSFFWNTKLPIERMKAISDWIGSLSAEDRSKLNDLLADVRREQEWYNDLQGI